MSAPWVATTTMPELGSADFAAVGVVFEHDGYAYRTTGRKLGGGGMGTVYEVERRAFGTGPVEDVVAKVFHASYLLQIRTDEVTRRDHQTNISAVQRLAALEHPNVLPMLVAAQIADNYLFVTPRLHMTLLEGVSRLQLSPRARVRLLLGALEGLAALHAVGLVHRDVTLRNVLLDERATRACLFDFDLALSLDEVGPVTYREHYRGRIFGSPGWSVAPETVDQSMQDYTISPALDQYGAGAALHALFTDQLVYGRTDDMWALLVQIGEGVVIGGVSRVHYPDEVPHALRPIIDRCLERDPERRFPSVAALIGAVRAVLHELPDGAAEVRRTQQLRDVTGVQIAMLAARGDRTEPPEGSLTGLSSARVRAEQAVWSWGYDVEQELGEASGHPLYLAVPRADLLASGQFPERNTFPKLVTLIDLTQVPDPRALVDAWQRHYLPILKKVRRAPIPALHKVIYDANTKSLLLFSEYIEDPRFGEALAEIDLPLDAAAALGFLVVRQVAALHEHGMAHGGIGPRSLLLKGHADSRAVVPAMIGLVEPQMGGAAMVADARALAGLLASWLRPSRIAGVPTRIRPMLEAMRAKLTAWAFDPQSIAPGIDDLVALTSDALALLDFNFSVLRDAGGDLIEHAQLVLSHRTYHLLWPARVD
jgi:serine/threonine protein kinase